MTDRASRPWPERQYRRLRESILHVACSNGSDREFTHLEAPVDTHLHEYDIGNRDLSLLSYGGD